MLSMTEANVQNRSQQQPPEARYIYRVPQLAEMLGLSERTIRRYLKKGQLRSVKLSSKTVLIPAEALQEFLSASTNRIQ